MMEDSNTSNEFDTRHQRELEAFVFRKLVEHLQDRTDAQNIDMMNLAGFCRNCLSKWYYAGAKVLGKPMSYEESCEAIYGMAYAEWKTKYQTKATPEQMAKYNESKHLHSKHAPVEKAAPAAKQAALPPTATPPSVNKSDACCEDPETMQCADDTLRKVADALRLKGVGASVAAIPQTSLRLGVLTVSDRAAAGVYADKSGPEVKRCVATFAERSGVFESTIVRSAVVPDDRATIVRLLRQWSGVETDGVDGRSICNIVFTTGGTGISPRDVTPEATLDVVDRVVDGIPEAARRDYLCAKHLTRRVTLCAPLTTLSCYSADAE